MTDASERTPNARFPDDRNSQVLVLGTHHFKSEGLDEVNTDFGDALGDKRQSEIEAVLGMLMGFQPTIIALEFPSTAEDTLNEFYKQYVADECDDSGKQFLRFFQSTEGFQLGFRLAKRLSLTCIYAIDEMTVRPLEQLEEFAKKHGYDDFLEHREQSFAREEAKENLELPHRTLVQLLLECNSRECDRESSKDYVSLIRLSEDSNRPGVEQWVEWYRRNGLIFENLFRITRGRMGERILVIYGSGHGYILRDLVQSAPDFELVDAADYLKTDQTESKV